MTNLTRRIEKLEGTADDRDLPTCIVVTDSPDESAQAAIARYRAEHPGTPEHANFVVVVTGFSRAPEGSA